MQQQYLNCLENVCQIILYLKQMLKDIQVCKVCWFSIPSQGPHRPEKYLNIEGFLEKYLKIKSALKSTENHPQALKSP